MTVLNALRPRRQALLIAVLFSALAVCLFYLAWQLTAAWELGDFAVTFYRVGSYFLHGQNVYANAYPHPFNGREYPPYAPIWALYPFVPFAELELPAAQALRILLDVAFLPFLAFVSARWAGLDVKSALLLVAAPWMLTQIHSGQLTPIVLLGSFLCYWGVERTHVPMTAVGLLLSLSKFTLVSLIVFATLCFAWRKKMLGRTLGFLIAVIAIASLASPTWFLDLFTLYADRLVHPRLSDSVLLLPGYPWAQLSLLAVGAAFVVACIWKGKMDTPTPWLWAALVAASLVGALHTFVYDWILLMVPLALLVRTRWGMWLAVATYVYTIVWTILAAGMDIPFPTVKIIPGLVLVAIIVLGVLRQHGALLVVNTP